MDELLLLAQRVQREQDEQDDLRVVDELQLLGVRVVLVVVAARVEVAASRSILWCLLG